VGESAIDGDQLPEMSSEDFADMLQRVPGAYGWLGHAGTMPLHNPGFVLDEDILPVGASILARVVERQLAASGS
jgi:metal-dependent amidase/aminoacylase/carboxypeptidase family protein